MALSAAGRPGSIERRVMVTIVLIAVAVAVVVAGAVTFLPTGGGGGAEAEAVADAVAASIGRGDAPAPLLQSLAAAGAALAAGLLAAAIGVAIALRRIRDRLRVSLDQLTAEMQAREVALRRRTTELESANRDLESFASAVAHDLRAPLGSILGFAQALEEDYVGALDDAGRECARWIGESAKQMQELLDGLTQMSRLSRSEMQRSEVDLSAMARGIAATLQRAHPEREVDFAIADGIVADGDERLLRAVMENLIGNAWKFTGKREAARIEIGVRREEGLPAYYVRDNGAGFDPEHAAKMFRPFQRLHSEREFAGTGIGLATVQKIVQRHGGRTWAEGEPGRGATIWFTTGSQQEAAP